MKKLISLLLSLALLASVFAFAAWADAEESAESTETAASDELTEDLPVEETAEAPLPASDADAAETDIPPIAGDVLASELPQNVDIALAGDTVLTLDTDAAVGRIGLGEYTLTVRGTGTLAARSLYGESHTLITNGGALVLESGTLRFGDMQMGSVTVAGGRLVGDGSLDHQFVDEGYIYGAFYMLSASSVTITGGELLLGKDIDDNDQGAVGMKTDTLLMTGGSAEIYARGWAVILTDIPSDTDFFIEQPQAGSVSNVFDTWISGYPIEDESGEIASAVILTASCDADRDGAVTPADAALYLRGGQLYNALCALRAAAGLS